MKVFLILASVVWSGQTLAATAQGPLNYDQSRFVFRSMCDSLSNECGNFKVPSEKDPDLTIDYSATQNSMSNRLLVVVCGTHGAEGPIGCWLLNKMIELYSDQLKEKGVNLLFVHAANPYGFKNSRRVTENNVDLNRNFQFGEKPKNEGYEKLKEELEPQGPAGHISLGFLRLSLQMVWRLLIREFSMAEMRQAVASGQYDNPKGLFFGGERPEPQVDFFRGLFGKFFKGHRDIVMIDIHTGLGKKGVLHLMPADAPTEGAQQLFQRVFPFSESEKAYQVTVATTQGFYKTNGSFNDFAQQQIEHGTSVAAVTMEFGTLGDDIVSQLRSLNRMVMDNQGAQFGYTSDSNRYRVQAEFTELFAPSSLEWQRDALEKTNTVFSLINKNF